MTAEYTSSLPVLSQEMIDIWKAEGDPLADHVFLSNSPGVFKKFGVAANRLCVWRKPQSPEVQNFIDTSLELFKSRASERLQRYLSASIMQKMNGEIIHLNIDGTIVTAEKIAALYPEPELSHSALAYGQYFMNSWSAVLDALPSWASLNFLDTYTTRHYASAPDAWAAPHKDIGSFALMHGTDPGTPYALLPGNSVPLFRTAAGDITFHGRYTLHGFATAEQFPGNRKCPRFMIGVRLGRRCPGLTTDSRPSR